MSSSITENKSLHIAASCWRFIDNEYTDVIISRSFLGMRNVSEKHCRQNQNTFYVQSFFPENRAVYEIMWKNVVGPHRPQIVYNKAHALCMLDN